MIRGQIHKVLRNSNEAKKDFKRAEKNDNENFVKFTQKKENVYLSVFPQQQRLCNSFAFVETTLSNEGSTICLRPSFSFPFIKPPNMIPCVDNQVLDGLNTKAVPLKPEAPWIKKCSFGIKFTDEIYMTDDDRENTPDEEKEYKKRKQRQQERAMEGYAVVGSVSEPVFLKNNLLAESSKPENQGEEEDQIEKIDKEEVEEFRRIAKKNQNAYVAGNEIHEGLNANRETDESGERSQNEEYQDDFDQRYREKSKAYERMDEINKLKQPLKPGKDQIRKDLNPEAVMREYVEEDFGYRKQNAKGQISQ